jgi:hypothetical protein
VAEARLELAAAGRRLHDYTHQPTTPERQGRRQPFTGEPLRAARYTTSTNMKTAPDRGVKRGLLAIASIATCVGALYLVIPPGIGCGCQDRSEFHRDLMKSQLVQVLRAQRQRLQDSSRYAVRVADLRFDRDTEVAVVFDSVTRRGFRALATVPLDSMKWERCVLWQGDPGLARPDVPEGQPRCWLERPPRWRFDHIGPSGWR